MDRYRPVRVLIVEDSPDDVEIARRAFARCGIPCELIVARDGQEAVDLACEGDRVERTPRPDFVLLDVNLPRVSGLDVLRRIRANEASAIIPVVMLTASGREEDVTQSYRLGANSYIQKPVVFDRFVGALTVLGQYWFDIASLPSEA